MVNTSAQFGAATGRRAMPRRTKSGKKTKMAKKANPPSRRAKGK